MSHYTISYHADELSQPLDLLEKTGNLRVAEESDGIMLAVSIAFALCRDTLTDLIAASFSTSMSTAMSTA